MEEYLALNIKKKSKVGKEEENIIIKCLFTKQYHY